MPARNEPYQVASAKTTDGAVSWCLTRTRVCPTESRLQVVQLLSVKLFEIQREFQEAGTECNTKYCSGTPNGLCRRQHANSCYVADFAISKSSFTLSPGSLSSRRKFELCNPATAYTRLSPNPLPGVDRLLSMRNSRCTTFS